MIVVMSGLDAGIGLQSVLTDVSAIPMFVQISDLLPKLAQADYFMSPSATQLAAMARMDPQSLQKVANFTIGRQRTGQIRWIDPVNVQGLDIDSTVRLSKETVEVRILDMQCQCVFVIGCHHGAAMLMPQCDGCAFALQFPSAASTIIVFVKMTLTSTTTAITKTGIVER